MSAKWGAFMGWAGLIGPVLALVARPGLLGYFSSTFYLQLFLGVLTLLTAFALIAVLYATRADSMLAEEPPAGLISKLEQRIAEERLAWRVLDLLHGAALVDGLQVSAAQQGAAAAGKEDEAPAITASSQPVDDTVRLSLVTRLVPLLYKCCTLHAQSLRVVSAAFALLTAVAPLEESDIATNRALVRPGGLRSLISALRRHVHEARAARYGALSLGISVNAACQGAALVPASGRANATGGPGGAALVPVGGRANATAGPGGAALVPVGGRANATAGHGGGLEEGEQERARDAFPGAQDLRDSADVCIQACELHPSDRDVQLWSLYALLHMAAVDDGELTAVTAGVAGAAGGGAGTAASNRALTRNLQARGPILLSLHPVSHCAAAVLQTDIITAEGTASDAQGQAQAQQASRAASTGRKIHGIGLGSRPYTLCAFLGERGAIDVAASAMRNFPADERLASVAILLLGVLAKSRADNWTVMLRSGAFDAVRHAVTAHRSSDKVMEVGTALLSVENKFKAMAGEPVLPLPAWGPQASVDAASTAPQTVDAPATAGAAVHSHVQAVEQGASTVGISSGAGASGSPDKASSAQGAAAGVAGTAGGAGSPQTMGSNGKKKVTKPSGRR